MEIQIKNYWKVRDICSDIINTKTADGLNDFVNTLKKINLNWDSNAQDKEQYVERMNKLIRRLERIDNAAKEYARLIDDYTRNIDVIGSRTQ